MSDPVTKFDIPVTYNFDRDYIIGRGTIHQDGDGSLITIKTTEPYPAEIFEGLVELSFVFLPGNPKGIINEDKSSI